MSLSAHEQHVLDDLDRDLRRRRGRPGLGRGARILLTVLGIAGIVGAGAWDAPWLAPAGWLVLIWMCLLNVARGGAG
jgi:fatty acid desaturase